MSNNYQQFDLFNQNRQALAALTRQQAELLDTLSMATWGQNIRQLEQQILTDNFKVLVLGEFKRGKSTFINALLGEDVLPAYAIPCTAIINEVKWSEKKRALLYFRPAEDGTAPPPREVPTDKLEQYVVIKDFANKEKEVSENPYDKVELFWPLELCRNGVEVIDSPGLNESEIRQKITLDYLGTVDAILFVLSCEFLGPSISEDATISSLHATGHSDIFFICNAYDRLNTDRDREMVKRHGLAQLSPRTEHGSRRIFFLSAFNALEARKHGNRTMLEQSGLLPLEGALEEFLAKDKGRIKILRPAAKLKASIYEAQRVIPEREEMLKTDVRTLEQRLEAAQEPLRRLETERQQIVSQVTNFIEDTKIIVREKARSFYYNLADEKLSGWASGYVLQNRVSIRFERVSSQVEKAAAEVMTFLSSRMEAEFATWQQNELRPLIEGKLADLKQKIDIVARKFVSHIDELRLDLASGGTSVRTVEVDGAKISPMERILAAAGGFLLGDIVTGGIGAAFGYKAMVVSLIQQVAIAAATIILVGFNPIILFPALIAGGLGQALKRIRTINNEIQQKVAQSMADDLRAKSYERGDEIAGAVTKKLIEIRDEIDKGLANEIKGIQSQVKSILEEKQKGQANVECKVRELKVLRQELDTINSKLDDLVNMVGLSR